jgi:hypothetical protein
LHAVRIQRRGRLRQAGLADLDQVEGARLAAAARRIDKDRGVVAAEQVIGQVR